MKVYKYNIDWQIVRSKLKKIKAIDQKITFVRTFYKEHPSQANKERILNWIDGLYIALRNTRDKALLNAFTEELKSYEVSQSDDTSRKPKTSDFNKYSDQDRLDLFKDLLVRAKKWLGAGYINKEFDEFMQELMKSLVDYDKAASAIESYNKVRERAPFIPNTYKWVF